MLPRFSDPRDIDDFVAKLEGFERGEIGADEFRAFRLTRGVYGQRQDGEQMIRVKIPYGQVGPEQLEALAYVADTYSRGFGHVTTRQNLQFHFIKMADTETAMRRLDEAGLTTRAACGNSVRTVTTCDLAEVCRSAAFDVTPFAEALTRYFLRHPLSETLPRKFKIAFSGCPTDCAKAAIHDLGFIATSQNGEPGFKVLAGGGLSSSPQNAFVLLPFIRAEEIFRVGEAILRLFHRLGNRENRQRARLKYVLRKLGAEKFAETFASILGEILTEAQREVSIAEPAARTPATAIVELPERSYLPWRASSVVLQKQAGFAAVYVRLALGDITSAQLRALARIVPRYGDGTLRFTIDQNVLIPWVDAQSLPAIHRELERAGLARTGIHTARDVTSCPGADTCNLAVTGSRRLARAITERLEQPNTQHLSAIASTVIKVSGCPNSCGQHHIADIGFHGGAKTINGHTYPIYQLHLGGGVDERGARFGRLVVKVIAQRAPEVAVRLLSLYEDQHAEGETPSKFFERIDSKAVTAALTDLLAAPIEQEQRDIGYDSGFLLKTREGECAA